LKDSDNGQPVSDAERSRQTTASPKRDRSDEAGRVDVPAVLMATE
jgi:hypothetical protein